MATKGQLRSTTLIHNKIYLKGAFLLTRFAYFYLRHQIDLVVLPSHTSHNLQPLDVSVFAPLKAAMTKDSTYTVD